MLVADAAKEDFSGVSCENENAVLVGLAPEYFNYEHMTTAFRLVSRICSNNQTVNVNYTAIPLLPLNFNAETEIMYFGSVYILCLQLQKP